MRILVAMDRSIKHNLPRISRTANTSVLRHTGYMQLKVYKECCVRVVQSTYGLWLVQCRAVVGWCPLPVVLISMHVRVNYWFELDTLYICLSILMFYWKTTSNLEPWWMPRPAGPALNHNPYSISIGHWVSYIYSASSVPYFW